MRYITTCELNEIIRRNINIIPYDVDLVVGIPRSGMLAASIIALLRNIRLTDIDSFVNGRIYDLGRSGHEIKNKKIKKVLIVDDTIQSGRSMAEARNKIAQLDNQYQILYCAIIASTRSLHMVDIYFTTIDDTRFFEWSFTRTHLLNQACVDIDGVICCNPKIDDDGEAYRSFLNDAEPLHIPQTHVDTLISCRLEKYRNQTTNWLKKYHIEYDNLIMLDLPNKQSRTNWGKPGEWKAEYYKQSNTVLFIESSAYLSKKIAKISHKPVFCIETNQLLVIPQQKPFLKRAIRKIKKLLNNLLTS